MSTRLKCLLMAIQQYKESRTATNAAKLQKQVEEVSTLPSEQLLTPGQPLPTECVSGLVDLAGNHNTSPALTSCIVSLLEQLASDCDSRELLHSSYSLTSTLASIIHSHSATPAEPLVLQCLRVLQKLTYNTRVFQSVNYFHELISFLMVNIQSLNDELITPCLGLMANLCRDNHSVQSYIKSLDNVKPFYRTLINFLAHSSLTVVVFTLSILASLTMNEKVGEKLFDAKNIHQTFQLVFNLVVNGTDTCKYAVDLLVDLLKNAKIADYLTRYKHFPVCVSKVLGLLHSKDPESAAKVLELLLSMCRISGLRSLLCEVVFKPAAAPKLRTARKLGQGPDADVKESGAALVQCLSCSVEGAEARTLQALQLLHELLEEALGADAVADSVLSYVEMLLPVLLDLLKGLDSAEGDFLLRKHCTRITHVTSLLLVLCAEDSTRTAVSRQVSATLCLSQVEELLACCHNNSPLTSAGPQSDHSLSQVSSEALLKTLELMSKLRQQVKDMVTSFYKMLQDQRIVTPLSLALTSHHRDGVQTALSLLFEATPLPEFPVHILGECIAANNAYRQREAELSVKRVAVQEFPSTRVNGSVLDSTTTSLHKSVSGLADKMQNGLALQEKPKDSLVSEVINVYEQKLSAFESKESRLQDLLEAKALALSQADRLIAQFRVQQAQAEAEARKLGCLLKEAERRREELQCELGSQVLEVDRCKSDIEELLKHNSRLQQDSEEHQTLKGAYNTLLNRFNESERTLKELQTAHIALTKQNDTLKKNHETLQMNNDRMVALVEERDEEIKSLQTDLQQKDSDIAGLRSELRAEEQERRNLEETVDVLRKELDKTQQARKDASIKASSLEQQRSQLELKLKQKEDELNKHSAMIAMIHSLSSGKMKNDSNAPL